eukprot:6473905-Amphidinium_carterae.2
MRVHWAFMALKSEVHCVCCCVFQHLHQAKVQVAIGIALCVCVLQAHSMVVCFIGAVRDGKEGGCQSQAQIVSVWMIDATWNAAFFFNGETLVCLGGAKGSKSALKRLLHEEYLWGRILLCT